MTWKLYDDFNVIDYEHFGIPFIINVEKLKSKIRNLRYRYMVNDNTLFPNEVDQYDNYILRELINNCIVHRLSEASDNRCYEKKKIMRSWTEKSFFYGLFSIFYFS